MAGETPIRRLTQQDRDDAENRLSASYQSLFDAVSGLTPEQWHFKPAPHQWSIAECVEHLAVSESVMLARDQRMLVKPALPGKESALTDQQLSGRAADLTAKLQAPEMLAPTGRWSNPRDALKQLKECRDQGIAQARGASDDLRAYFSKHPAFGDLDGFQWLCLRAGHTERHTLQIKAIQTIPAFPR
jgi:hypothetical protein